MWQTAFRLSRSADTRAAVCLSTLLIGTSSELITDSCGVLSASNRCTTTAPWSVKSKIKAMMTRS
jgi:hypothetical protein